MKLSGYTHTHTLTHIGLLRNIRAVTIFKSIFMHISTHSYTFSIAPSDLCHTFSVILLYPRCLSLRLSACICVYQQRIAFIYETYVKFKGIPTTNTERQEDSERLWKTEQVLKHFGTNFQSFWRFFECIDSRPLGKRFVYTYACIFLAQNYHNNSQILSEIDSNILPFC